MFILFLILMDQAESNSCSFASCLHYPRCLARGIEFTVERHPPHTVFFSSLLFRLASAYSLFIDLVLWERILFL